MGSADDIDERTRRDALAEFALALTGAGGRMADSLRLAARVVADLVGDVGAVRLIGDDGYYGQFAICHEDPEVVAGLTRMYGEGRQRVDEGFHREMAVGKSLVLNDVTPDWLRANLPADMAWTTGIVPVHALMDVPLMSDGLYMGYLALLRITPGGSYTEADLELATNIGTRVALAVRAAHSTEQLRASEAQYRRIVETAAEGIWQVGADGIIEFVNEHLATMLGSTPAELIGRSVMDFVDPSQIVAASDRLAEHRYEAGQLHQQQLIRTDGSRVDVQAVVTPLNDEAGNFVGIFAMVTDITDRLRREALEEQVDQMRRLDSLGQLAGGIAHDFKNLLMVIGGFAQVLTDRLPEDSPLLKAVQPIADAATRGDELTSQLLAFARGGTGSSEILDLSKVVADLELILRRTLGEHIELRMQGGPSDIWPVKARRGQLEQVIVNLAANARDAMPGGGQLIVEVANTTLDTSSLAEGGKDHARFVRLAVSDTGTGMDAETQRRAFEPFFTTKEQGRGTGLGLATTYGIIRGNDGYVHLYSEAGTGTTIKVYLPATADAVMASADEAEEETSLPAGLTILVVDDQPAVAEAVRQLLESAACVVLVENDPRTALAALRAGLVVDLLITDVIMPGMTGAEMVRALRSDRPELPVIFMSGHTAGMLDVRDPLVEGAPMLEKPFSRASLAIAVRTVLRRSGRSDLLTGTAGTEVVKEQPR